MCQREYLISRIFKLLVVLLKRAYFLLVAVSHKCFMVSEVGFEPTPPFMVSGKL